MTTIYLYDYLTTIYDCIDYDSLNTFNNDSLF